MVVLKLYATNIYGMYLLLLHLASYISYICYATVVVLMPSQAQLAEDFRAGLTLLVVLLVSV